MLVQHQAAMLQQMTGNVETAWASGTTVHIVKLKAQLPVFSNSNGSQGLWGHSLRASNPGQGSVRRPALRPAHSPRTPCQGQPPLGHMRQCLWCWLRRCWHCMDV